MNTKTINMSKREIRWDILVPLVCFATLLLFKLLVVIDNRSLPIIADEFLYAKYARLLFENGSYSGTQYPLLYPLALAPAYLFDDYFTAMKVINSIFSSLTVVIVYFISRLYLDERKSAVCAIFTMVIPFQYITPMILMSENIYFPLFLLSIYVSLRSFKREILSDILLGVLIGLMYLTRHITLVCIPVFLFGWLLKQLEKKEKISRIILRGLMICVVAGLVYSPWTIMCLRNGRTLKNSLGFSIASKTNPEQLTFDRILMSGGFYAAYMIIMIAPVLGVALKSFKALDVKNLFCKFNRLWVMVWGTAAAFFVAVTRHSWRAYYNYPDFLKIKGRYLIYFSVLFFILAMVTLYDRKPVFKHKWINIVLTYVVPMLLIIVSYMADFKGIFYSLDPIFIDTYECIDGRRIKFIGDIFVPAIIIGLLVYQFIYDFANSKWKKYGLIIFGVVTIGTQAWGMCSYLEMMESYNITNNEKYSKYVFKILDEIEKVYDNNETIYIFSDDGMPDVDYVKRVLVFAKYDNVVVTVKMGKILTDDYWVVVNDKNLYEDTLIEELTELESGGDVWYLKRVMKQ